MARESKTYTEKFYRDLEATRESAREILPIVLKLVNPQSIVDIGCGRGHWLAAAAESGINDVLGVDGDWVLKTPLEVPRDKFLARDLTQELKLGRKFDLALSLEVAEHLPENRAPLFVQTLCQAANVVLFSAAIPGQGGRHHVNEQWPDYWAHLFNEYGFECFDFVRAKIWNNPNVLWYYAQNSLIFARKGVLNNAGEPANPLSLVHPALWSAQVARLNSPGKLLEQLPKAIVSAMAKK